MSAEPSTTSSRPSQASVMVRDSIEPGQSALTPPPPVTHGPGMQRSGHVFQPLQMLMDTIITIEYGDELQNTCGVHEGIMCCNSQQVQSWCAQAKSLRGKYDKCEEIAQKLTSISMLAFTKAKFEENAVEDEILKIVGYVYAHFPLDRYQSAIKKHVDTVLVTQITEKHVKNVPATPKTNTKAYHELSLNGRLELLDYEGMVNLVERVSSTLNRIKAVEKEKAKDDALKAMAQERILLPGVSETSVKSLLAWIYQGALRFENSRQLYDVYEVAVKLRVDALAEKCLSQLSNAASDIIQQARCEGISLGALLGFPAVGDDYACQDQHVPHDNTVEVVFQHVLKDSKPPKRLLDLVVDALAAGLDTELWAQIQDTIGHPIALRLVEAMLHQRRLKAGSLETPDAAVKFEDQQEVDDARPNLIGTHQQSVITG